MKKPFLRKLFVLALAASLPLAADLLPAPVGERVGVALAAPEAKEGWYRNIVDTDFVKQYVQVPARKDVAIIDSRPAARRYDAGHIVGAINIPDTQFDKFKDRLPADKATLLIFYCGGLDCMLSHDSARKAEAMGYANIKVYAEGYPAWSAAFPDRIATVAKKGLDIQTGKEKGSISAASFEKILAESPEAVLFVDVRDTKEFSGGTLKVAKNIPINQLEKQVESLPADKPVIFFCGTGGRAGEAYDTVKLLRPEVVAYFLDADTTFNLDGSYKITKAR